ncbi:MAG: efflux RND transporter permease subunit [Rhodothermales bacterium]
MRITNLAIQYRTSILVLTGLLVVGGLISYQTIPKESNPSIEIPNIIVTTVYPGASPDDIESLITQHIEQEVQSINGITEIRSTSTEGVSTVVIEFDPDVSIDEALQKVRDKVNIAKSEIPGEAEEPLINEIDVQEFPIMTINLASSYSLARLKEVAEELEDELESIPTVLEVDLIGGLEREVQVNVNLSKLQGYNLAFEDVIMAIQQENTNIPGGSVDVDRTNYLVRVNGEIETPEELKDLVIDAPDGTPVYIRDVADVLFAFKERATFSRLEIIQEEDRDRNVTPLSEEEITTLQVVSLNVKNRPGANILETVELIDEKLETFVLPNGTEYVVTGDVSYYVESMIKDLENNIISGLIFVVAVLLFFLGIRNAFLVGIAIPLSMFISFIVLQSLGYTLNFIILFSLIIALGMLVDNAVVIVENIYRYREMGHSRFEAARLGTTEVGGAVVASTATTVAAFAPMLFWPGIIGEFMSYLPLTLIITLTSSLFVAIIINPVITGIFVKLEGEDQAEKKQAAKIVAAVVILVLGLVLALANWKSFVVLGSAAVLFYGLNRVFFKPVGEKFVREGLPRLVDRYRGFIRWMLERDYSVKRAMLRNTFALGSFTGGLILCLLGAVVSSVMNSSMAGRVLLVPGMMLAGAGLIGILFHTFENIYLGGKKSIRIGIIFGVIMGLILTLMWLSEKVLDAGTVSVLVMAPALIVITGLAGWAFNSRKQLVLTDNRAKLLNGTLGSLVAIFALFGFAPTGVEFFPTSDPNMIAVTFDSPLGTNVETSNAIAHEAQERIDELLRQNPKSRANVKNVLMNVGIGGDAMFGGGTIGPETSQITLNLMDYEDRAEDSPITMAALRDQLKGIPGTEVEFTQDQNGPPTGAPVNIEITGDDFDRIIKITKDVKAILSEASETGQIPGLVDVSDNVNTGRPELNVKIDRERAARFGLNTSQIASTVRSAINGTEAGKYRTGDDEYDITVRLSEFDRSSLESIKNLTIPYEGDQIPLVSVAETEVQGGLGSITRLDMSRVATVTGNAAGGFNGNEILAEVQVLLADYEANLPVGYSMTYTGESEEQQESFSFLTYVLLIGVSLIFMILVAQFNKVSSPFIIMVAVGLSLIGVLLGLILTRTPFGLMTFIGIISLAGIVVNNNIVLIDYIMQLRTTGMDKQAAIVEGGATRLRPVVLTALTTVLGLIPLTFGLNMDFVGLITNLEPSFSFKSANTDFWGPMGTSIISGLTFATFLTLVIVPVMYSVFDSLSLRLADLFKSTDDEDKPVAKGKGNGLPNKDEKLSPQFANQGINRPDAHSKGAPPRIEE